MENSMEEALWEDHESSLLLNISMEEARRGQ
jgi:hypothetical protein